MERNFTLRTLLVFLSLTLLLSSCTKQGVPKSQSQTPASAPWTEVVFNDFKDEKEGFEPDSFAAVVGVWTISSEDKNKVLKVDGSKWTGGTAAPNLEEKTNLIFGTANKTFLNAIKNHPEFPLVIAKKVQDFHKAKSACVLNQ